METPSGQFFDNGDLTLLELMTKYGFIQRRDTPFKLKSGVLSNVYVFGREDITDHPDLEWKIGRKIASLVRRNGIPGDKQACLIGIPTAGTPFAQAAAMVSYIWGLRGVGGRLICHRIMKEIIKEHGAHPKWVNGDPRPDIHTYWTVDNVVTDGKSKFEASDRLRGEWLPG